MTKRDIATVAGLACCAVSLACNGRVDVGALPGQEGGSSEDGSTGRAPSEDAGGTLADAPADVQPVLPPPEEPLAEASADVDSGVCVAPPSSTDAACFASCCIPAGTVQPFSTVDEVYGAMVGRWQICAGGLTAAFPDAPADVIGVEYGPVPPASDASAATPTGNMYYLVQGPSGPVRGEGFAYQLTYDVSQEGPSSFQLNMHPTPNSGFGGSFRYSPCPTELSISGYPSGSATLVPFY
jgi:hypothetical protein